MAGLSNENVSVVFGLAIHQVVLVVSKVGSLNFMGENSI